DGPDARPHGASRFRRLRLRSAFERQPSLRRVPNRNPAASRRRAGRVQEFPRAPASRQGQGRVRPVHGAAQAASDPAERPAAARLSVLQGSAAGMMPPWCLTAVTTAHLRKQVGGSFLYRLAGGGPPPVYIEV